MLSKSEIMLLVQHNAVGPWPSWLKGNFGSRAILAQMEEKSPTEQEKAPAIAPQPVASRRRRRAASDTETVDPLESDAPAPLPTLLGSSGEASRRWKRLHCACPKDGECNSQKRCMHCLECFSFSAYENIVDCPRTGFPIHEQCPK